MASKAQKLAERRIERAYSMACSGMQIDIMDIGKVFAVGHKAISEGVDDANLMKTIYAFVQTIRRN